MKLRILAIAALLTAFAGPASASSTLVAGWDFSQWAGSGLLSEDNVTFQDTLSANYSDLDPTFNAGLESAAFGELYFDGTNGSTDVAEGTSGQAFAPIAVPGTGSLASNLDAPSPNPFDSHTILANEGQVNTNLLGMSANQVVSVVFGADITSVPLFATGWDLSLGGIVLGGDLSAVVTLDFSKDGVTYSSIGSFLLSGTDSAYSVHVENQGERGFFRLNMLAGPGEQVVIDNVAISATVPVLGSNVMTLIFCTLLGFVALRPSHLA